MNITKTDKCILKNMTNEEKFKIICRQKNININYMVNSIIENIKADRNCDQDCWIGTYSVPDTEWGCGEKFGGYILYVDKYLTEEGIKKDFEEQTGNKFNKQTLYTIEEWAEEQGLPILTTKEQEFVKLAIKYKYTEFET